MKKRKGFDLNALIGIGVTFVVIAIVLSFGGEIIGDLRTTFDDGLNETAYNVTGFGLESIEEFSSWLPTLALIIVAAVIIGIIIRYFMVRGGGADY